MTLIPKHHTGKRRSLDLSQVEDNSFKLHHKKFNLFNNSNNLILKKLRWKQLFILYIIFLIVIHYFERIKPKSIIKSCIWENWENWDSSDSSDLNPHHSIIIGDPQIVDEYSYPTRNWIELEITKFFSDNFLHRNHNIYSKLLNPDSIIFAGDLFDGGREWEDKRWMKEYIRFNKIFNPIENIQQFRQIPGNHDIGFGNGIDFEKYSRFKTYFGNSDNVHILGNHSIVLLDTVSLSCTDNSQVNNVSIEFLKSFQSDDNPYKKYPRIVFSHVPLYRFTELQICSSSRESNDVKFPVSKGKQYQTVLEYDLSQNILNWINPILLFSGDDHDYCHIRHPFRKNYSKDPNDYKFNKGQYPGIDYCDEITVKSSAMTGGISKPAIQLLSLWNPKSDNDNWVINNKESQIVDSKTAKSYLCYLPSPYQPLIHYLITLIFGIWWIFICTIQIGYGNRLNKTMIRNLYKLKKSIQKLFKKDIKSIDITYIEAKSNNNFERIFNDLLDWEIENQIDWKSFLINSIFYLFLVFLTLVWYFKSI